MRHNVLHTILFTPLGNGHWGVPFLFWGPPGIGKSAVLEALRRRYKGWHVETLSPGERGEGAFGVVPVPVRGVLTYPAPDWVENLEHGGVVFLDEMSTAEPALQKPLLGMLQARRIGSTEFSPGVRVLGAANPVDMATGGWDITPALSNRQGHMDWHCPSGEEWADWLLSSGSSSEEAPAIDPRAEEERVLKAWPNPWAKACGLVAGFVRRRPELLHRMPTQGSPEMSRAWPSPRSWEYATRLIAAVQVHGGDEALADDLVTGMVGQAAAAELAAWRAEADLPEPADVLDGRVEFSPDRKRLDRTQAVLSACAALVAPKTAEKRDARAGKLWGLLDGCAAFAIDVTVTPARQMANAGLGIMDEAAPLLGKLEPVLGAAGVRARRR